MTDPSRPLIEIEKLTKRFTHRGKELVVLEEMDVNFFAGDRIAIMGPSGAGKSTLLQVLGTLDTPTSGRIRFGGEDVFKRSSSALARFRNEQIGFVFQFHHLLPEFTALENVMMPGLIRRMKRNEAQIRAEELLELVGLTERVHHQPGELSGGEQQRVAIARALFNKPRLLLADEPTGNLDPQTSVEVMEVLQEINKNGNTILMATHDYALLLKYPSKTLKCDENQIFEVVQKTV